MEKVLDNRFELESEKPIDESSLFFVYKAKDRVTGKPVIIKVLKDVYAKDRAMVSKFRNYFLDFQTKVRNTKNLCKVSHIAGTPGSMVYMVQEFVKGQTLEEYVQKKSGLTSKGFKPIFQDICSGLHNLHNRDLMHYKVLPKNVIIDENKHAKLIGFGSLSLVLGDKDLLKKALGDLKEYKDYIAPEILEGKEPNEITSQCDIYTLGKLVENLPLQINETLVKKAINKNPEMRFKDIRSFMKETENLFIEEPEKTFSLPLIEEQKANPKSPESFKYKLPLDASKLSNLKVKCINLPKFAIFDENNLEFEWKPGIEDTGSTQIKFEVICDEGTETIVLPVKVGDIEPPSITIPNPPVLEIRSHEESSFNVKDYLRKYIPDVTTLVIRVVGGLPKCSSFENSEFVINPMRSQAGQAYKVKFEVNTDSGQHIIELPVHVKKITIILKDRLGSWGRPGSFTFNQGETVFFNVANPDPENFRIRMSNAPPEADSARFDDSSSEFKWKINNKVIGNYIFEFQAIDQKTQETVKTKEIMVHILGVPEKKEKEPKIKEKKIKDRKVVDTKASTGWKNFINAFKWIYNLIFFGAGAFAVVLFLPDIIIGFVGLIILEGIYLLIASNDKFQEYFE